MRKISKRNAAFGIAALAVGLIGLSTQLTPSFAADLLFAQSNDTRGKSDNNNGRPGNPGTQVPPAATQTPSSTQQPNSPQTGVPARCASVANATERQKCMETPKGQ